MHLLAFDELPPPIRHRERSVAIHDPGLHGLPRYARNDKFIEAPVDTLFIRPP